MSSILLKQPNGKYAEYDTKKRCFTYTNMEEDFYVDVCKNRAKQKAEEQARKKLSDISADDLLFILHAFFPISQTVESFALELKELGFDLTEEQMSELQLKEKKYLEDADYYGFDTNNRKGC